MSSRHVDEVFAEDVILRRKIKDICKKHMQLDEAIDQEVRDRIKNLDEGTRLGSRVRQGPRADQAQARHQGVLPWHRADRERLAPWLAPGHRGRRDVAPFTAPHHCTSADRAPA